MKTPALQQSTPLLSDAEIARRILERLRTHGPECVSELARELVCGNADVLRVLQALGRAGVLSVRPHHCEAEYADDERRWGIAR